MKREAVSFLLAVQFLTRLPVPASKLWSPERMAGAVKYYPMVGIIVGGISAVAFWIASFFAPALPAVLLAIAVGLLLTGAFHEDGLADTFDGIGGGQTKDRALEIMKDSRLGTYGTLALGVTLAIKAGALVALPAALLVSAIVAGHGLSRLSSVLVIATSSYVRGEGTDKPVAGAVSTIGLVVALLNGMAIVLTWLLFWSAPSIAFALGGLVLGHVLMRSLFERKLGGYTGDTLGAVQQVSEIGFYLGLVAWL